MLHNAGKHLAELVMHSMVDSLRTSYARGVCKSQWAQTRKRREVNGRQEEEKRKTIAGRNSSH